MALRYMFGGDSTASDMLGMGPSHPTLTTWAVAGDGIEFTIIAGNADAAYQGRFFGVAETGGLWTWGDNNPDYAMGTGDTADRTSPVQLLTGDFTHVACGHSNNGFAVKADGTLWGWGQNSSYELGNGSSTDVQAPAQIGADTNWAKVYGGTNFSIGLRTDGTIWAAGSNAYGQTGQNTAAGNLTTWTQIGTDTDWSDIRCGGSFTLLLKTGGSVWGCGAVVDKVFGAAFATDLLVPTQILAGPVSAIGTGLFSSWVLYPNDELWVAGRNYKGELGTGDVIGTTLADWKQTAVGLAVAAFWVGFQGTAVRTTAGDAYITGDNTGYRVGLPTSAVYNTFNAVPAVEPLAFYANIGAVSLRLPPQPPQELVVDYAAFADATAPDQYAVWVASVTAADTIADSTFTFYIEAIGLSDSLAAGANTTTSLADSAAVHEVIQQAVNQIVADSADGADSLNIGAALTLVEIADAVAAHDPTYNSVMLVAELIATLEAYNSAPAYDITEAGVLSDAYVARVEALVAMLESHYIQDVNEATVSVYQLAADSADSTMAITSAGSLLNALLSDAVLATIRLNIGGELFTGWVLNADTLAPSEYQFADLQFNSACKHGDIYLLAADDGIYQFTEDAGVETVMTYIKTGKTDFGSDMRKSVTNAYMVYSAAGQMTLKVTTSVNGALQTNDYAMVPFAADDTPDPQRVTVGKGLKSRYWQFELTGANAGCTFDEIGMLPVVLSRRI